MAKILFCYDNPPGTRVISVSQDAIGLVFPGLAYAYYDNTYWPSRFEHRLDEPLLRFVENALYLVPLGPRYADYDVLTDTVFDREVPRLWQMPPRGIGTPSCGRILPPSGALYAKDSTLRLPCSRT